MSALLTQTGCLTLGNARSVVVISSTPAVRGWWSQKWPGDVTSLFQNIYKMASKIDRFALTTSIDQTAPSIILTLLGFFFFFSSSWWLVSGSSRVDGATKRDSSEREGRMLWAREAWLDSPQLEACWRIIFGTAQRLVPGTTAGGV